MLLAGHYPYPMRVPKLTTMTNGQPDRLGTHTPYDSQPAVGSDSSSTTGGSSS
jgi:hypothetical protein